MLELGNQRIKVPSNDEPIPAPLSDLLNLILAMWDEFALNHSHAPAKDAMEELREFLEDDE